MHKLFKPLSKRDAKIAAVLFGIGFLYMLFNTVKDVLSGKTFDELHADLLLLAFIGIIEWGMVSVGFTKDKDKEDEESEESGTEIEAADEIVFEDVEPEEDGTEIEEPETEVEAEVQDEEEDRQTI